MSDLQGSSVRMAVSSGQTTPLVVYAAVAVSPVPRPPAQRDVPASSRPPPVAPNPPAPALPTASPATARSTGLTFASWAPAPMSWPRLVTRKQQQDH